MLSTLLKTSLRSLRSSKLTGKSIAKTQFTTRVEQLEDRTMLTTSPFFSRLGVPDGSLGNIARGISGDGQTVVGFSGADAGAFRWTQESGVESLGLLEGATQSSSRAASQDGSVVVGTSNDGASESFRWTEETGMIAIPDLPGDNGSGNGVARDVSDDGTVIVGGARSTEGRQAYIWNQGVTIQEPGETVGLGDLPGGSFDSIAYGMTGDGSTVVGRGTNSDNRHQAFIWNDVQGMAALSDTGFRSNAFAISDDGSVVVGYDVIAQETERYRGKYRTVTTQEAVRWTDTGMELLGDLPGGDHYSEAHAVSEDGSVIAGLATSSYPVAGGAEAFIWDTAHGMRSLQDVLTTDYGLDLTGWHLRLVYDMTPDGLTFVGEGINPDGNFEGFIAKITPPSPGITVTPNSQIQTSEDGTTDIVNVVLDAEPADAVAIHVSSSDVTEGEIAGATDGVRTLTFDATNWNIPQQVTIQGVEDAGEQDGNQPYLVQLDPSPSADPDYAALNVIEVTATNLDNDAPAPSNTIYVYDILDEFDTRTRGRNNTDHRIVIDVRHDDNGDASDDVGIGGVQVTVELRDSSGSLVGTYTGTSDTNGFFYSDWIKGLTAGETYRAEVTDMALAGYDWDLLGFDPTFLDEDEDGDGKPDQLLST